MKIGVFALKDFNKSKDLPKFYYGAKKLNMDIEFFNPKDICIEIKNNSVTMHRKDKTQIRIDGAVNWIPYAKYEEISYACDRMAIPYINSVDAVRNCRNKVLTNIILSDQNIYQPYSIYFPHMNFSDEINPDMDYPFIYKRKSGSHGIGAQKFNNQADVKNLLSEKYYKDYLYFQEYIKNFGYDYRILTVGDKIVGGMKKHYTRGEWRTHVAHGGKVEKYNVPEYYRDISRKIMKSLNLHFAGIDIMPASDGKAYVLEVNSVPGMTIFNNLTNINLAEEILLHLKVIINR